MLLRLAAAAAATLPGGLAAAADPPTATPPAEGWEARRTAQAPWPQALETFDAAWTLVHETHFDPDFNGVDWEAVRAELRPRAAAAASEDELRGIVQDMLGRLGQSHFQLIPRGVADVPGPDDAAAGGIEAAEDGPDGEETDGEEPDEDVRPGVPGDLGLTARVVDGLVLVTRVDPGGPADAAGLRPGTELKRVDGVDLQERLEELEQMDAGIRQMVVQELLTALLDGDAGARVRLEAETADGETLELRIARRVLPAEVVKFGNLPPMPTRLESTSLETSDGGRIGVVRFNIWLGPVAAAFAEAIDEHRDADGIVIDLRGNPGGVGALAMGLAGHLLSEKVSLGTLKTRGAELQFNVNPQRIAPDGDLVEPYAGPVAILVDATSASTSELFAGGLQALGRVRVFGETTMGAALPAQMNRLPNGDVLLHAFADFLIPGGTSLEGRGVVPDEAVPLDRARLARGEDPPLAAARAWIDALASGAGSPVVPDESPRPAAEPAGIPQENLP